MRILLVSHFYPPEIGAPQRRLDAFVRRWREQGADVDVVTSLPHYPSGTLVPGSRWAESFRPVHGSHGERVVRVPFFSKNDPNGAIKMLDHTVVAAASLPPVLAGPRPDVVLATVLSLPAIAVGRAAATRWRCPFVIEMRDAWPDLLFKSGYRAGILTRAAAALVTRAQRNADHVVTVTEGFRRVLVERGVAEEKTSHISNGIDVERVPQLPPIDDENPMLHALYLGTHGVSQGLDNVVRALSRMHRPVTARFIGSGADKARVAALAAALDAPIAFEEPVSGDALWDAYTWADTCLVPLQPWDAFEHTVPSKIYELMAAGRHISGSLSGEAADTVHSAGAGFAAEPGDADALARELDAVASDRNRLLVGRGPREWVARNAGYSTLADRYLELFESIA